MCGESHETKKTVFRIWNKNTGRYEGSYSRSCHDEYDFDSRDSALNANCHGMFMGPEYEIHECVREYTRVATKRGRGPGGKGE